MRRARVRLKKKQREKIYRQCEQRKTTNHGAKRLARGVEFWRCVRAFWDEIKLYNKTRAKDRAPNNNKRKKRRAVRTHARAHVLSFPFCKKPDTKRKKERTHTHTRFEQNMYTGVVRRDENECSLFFLRFRSLLQETNKRMSVIRMIIMQPNFYCRGEVNGKEGERAPILMMAVVAGVVLQRAYTGNKKKEKTRHALIG